MKKKMYSLWESASQNPKGDENVNDRSEERSGMAAKGENTERDSSPSTKMGHQASERHYSGGTDHPDQRLAECDKRTRKPAKHTTDLRAKKKMIAYGGSCPIPSQSNNDAHMVMYIHDEEKDENIDPGAIAVRGHTGTTQSSYQEHEESSIRQEIFSNSDAQTVDSLNLPDDVINLNPDTPVLQARVVERDDPSALVQEVRQLREEMAHGRWIPEGESVVPAQAISTETTKGVSIATQIRRRRRRIVALISVMLLVAVAVVLGIVLGGGSGGPEQKPVKDLLVAESLVDNDALDDVESPQYKAMVWLTSNTFLADYPDWQRLQRFALATLYFSTNGDKWHENRGWLSDEDVCGWYLDDPSERCNDAGNLAKLTLESNNLNGTIPAELGLLSDSLVRIAFPRNSLTGTIPSEIGLMRRVEQMFFNQNSLTGTIPTEIGNFKIMKEFFLEENKLTGSIPTEIGLMAPHLGRILFGNNHLAGTIPTELALLPDLEFIRIEKNRFTGSIPSEIGLLANRMAWISIHDSALTGIIPNEFCSLPLLKILHLHNNFLTGTVPECTLRMQELENLYLYNNSLTGNYTCAESVPVCKISCDNISVACRSL